MIDADTKIEVEEFAEQLSDEALDREGLSWGRASWSCLAADR